MKTYIHAGDCRLWLPTVASESVDLIVTSPPYNCRKAYGGNFVDEMPWPIYYDFIDLVLVECYRVLRLGGTIAVNVPSVVRWQSEHASADSWSDFDRGYQTHRRGEKVVGKGRVEPIGFNLFAMMARIDNHMREPIVWVKGAQEGDVVSGDFRMGSDSDPYMRPAHEMIIVGSKGQWHHRGGTGRRGRGAVPFLDMTKDVWFIAPERSQWHPAVFPIQIPRQLITLFCHAPNCLVLDPFAGAGTVGLAAAEAGLPFIGCEQNPKFAARADSQVAAAYAQPAPMGLRPPESKNLTFLYNSCYIIRDGVAHLNSAPGGQCVKQNRCSIIFPTQPR